MSKCIKCGKEIPEGELFCQECSLNAGSSLFEESQAARYTAPPGQMQAPQPVHHSRVQTAVPQPSRRKKHRSRGLKLALFLMTLLFLGSVGLMFSQYGKIQVAKARLRTKEADIALRLSEVDDLEAEIEELTTLLGQTNQQVADKEAEIQELMQRLSKSQSSQSQGEYDLDQTQLELQRLEEENLKLLALSDDLKTQLSELRTKEASLETDLQRAQAKADFMDRYVVFVENDDTGYFHTYDCKDFSKQDFWAYSRGVAQHKGYTPCPVCGGGIQ